jgi:hypothetical protein
LSSMADAGSEYGNVTKYVPGGCHGSSH